MTVRPLIIAAAFLFPTLPAVEASAQVINGCITKNGTLKIVADPLDSSTNVDHR